MGCHLHIHLGEKHIEATRQQDNKAIEATEATEDLPGIVVTLPKE